MAEEPNGRTAEKLALTREEFAEFRGEVRTMLTTLTEKVSNVESDVSYIRECQLAQDKRLGQLENTGTVLERVKAGWREWAAVAIACGAVLWNVFHH